MPESEETADVEAVNIGERTALMTDGRMAEIVKLIDGHGEDTEDESRALAAVARLGDDEWLAIDLGQFETVPMQ